MSIHNICFPGEIRKITILLDGKKKHLFQRYVICTTPGSRALFTVCSGVSV